jgi:hypothetical protein
MPDETAALNTKNLILTRYPYSLCTPFWLKYLRGCHEKVQALYHDMGGCLLCLSLAAGCSTTHSAAMDQSARAMAPVLAKLNDMALFLKHNLNARAIGALGKEALSIETDVDALIQDMNRAIAEADRFIAHM